MAGRASQGPPSKKAMLPQRYPGQFGALPEEAKWLLSLVFLERAKGFEPSTPTLARLCSTPELRPLWRPEDNSLSAGGGELAAVGRRGKG